MEESSICCHDKRVGSSSFGSLYHQPSTKLRWLPILDEITNQVGSLVDKKGEYTVKANYRHLESDASEAISIGLIWNSCIPPKVSVFTWEVWWGKVLTMDQLKKRGFQLTSRCPLCKEDEETIDHLLLHYPSIWGFWAIILSVPGVVWACPPLAFPIRKKARNTWKAAFPCLLWVIWKERNSGSL